MPGEQNGLLDAPEELPPLPAVVEVACYRIIQEVLTNVARHARTCCVRLSVDRGSGVLGVEITDDGAGIPGGRVAGVGLSSMRERAEELGGILRVEREPEGGTLVLARLPLPASRGRPRSETPSRRAPWVCQADHKDNNVNGRTDELGEPCWIS